MPAAILARLVLLDARRGGLPWLALAGLALALLLAGFLSQVALTEARSLQLAVVAALLRAVAVFLVAVQVSASVVREMNDKGKAMLFKERLHCRAIGQIQPHESEVGVALQHI